MEFTLINPTSEIFPVLDALAARGLVISPAVTQWRNAYPHFMPPIAIINLVDHASTLGIDIPRSITRWRQRELDAQTNRRLALAKGDIVKKAKKSHTSITRWRQRQHKLDTQGL
jgi:hypothetical protein